MAIVLPERIKNAWSAFKGRDPTYYLTDQPHPVYISFSSENPYSRYYSSTGNSKSIITTVYNQIAVDVSKINIRHVQLNDSGNYERTVNSGLMAALSRSANLDQTGRSLIRDLTMTLLEHGSAAVVPILADDDPDNGESWDILELRVGIITNWMPKYVTMEVYDENIGRRRKLTMPKKELAIVENPFFSIMNAPNATAQRLLTILGQLDRTNETNSAGKMDMLIKLPFSTRHEVKKDLANKRRQELEDQMNGSQYGIGYIDGSEQVIQLNRSIENNLWEQAKDLTEQLFNQLGMNQTIFDGTADEHTLMNYQNRTIEPILQAITEEMERKWISKTGISQGKAIRYFSNPFKLIPASKLAELSDKLTRNEIMSSNEIRAELGLLPSKDPKADQLRNSNLNHPDEKMEPPETANSPSGDESDNE